MEQELSGKSEHELGELLHKNLFGRRYLIIMDDLWSIEAWDEVRFFFPHNCNGSRILITTRLTNLAVQVTDTYNVLKMKFLDVNDSWNLFRKSAFGKEACPLELEELGKKITKSCKGLPLSITVIGGLLSKHEQSIQYWESILENLNPILNLEDNEHCLKILRTSYKELPVHLKPCFLHMGIFPEDHVIRISMLIKLWVAEGFPKPISGKSLEMVAEEYLQDLVDRNLISVHKLGSTGKIKYCKIHDLLRDLCLKEAQKGKFFRLDTSADLKIPQDIKSLRRIEFNHSTNNDGFNGSLQSASYARSLVCLFGLGTRFSPFVNFRLLRALLMMGDKFGYSHPNYYPETIFQLVNSRFIEVFSDKILEIPSSVHHLWNLQTLVVHKPIWTNIAAPIEIWKMTQLRHLKIDRLKLPDPPVDDFIVLENLETLETVCDFKFSEEVVKRIPNIKKLRLYHNYYVKLSPANHLGNLVLLQKLESLYGNFGLVDEASWGYMGHNLSFPDSLKKLTLLGTKFEWEDMETKMGLLPRLEVLKLCAGSFIGAVWETVEGQFNSLKFLLIEQCYLEYWKTDSTHFPSLQYLVLQDRYGLKRIPLEIGEIPTLRTIEMTRCKKSAHISAREILEEQEGLGNFGLRLVEYDDD